MGNTVSLATVQSMSKPRPIRDAIATRRFLAAPQEIQ
jgi:hypothetical protein